MRLIRPALIALLAAVCMTAAAPAAAVAFSIDQSDLWYIPAESGWGMQLVQRNATIFATLFVYDPAGNPVWYVATMNPIATSVWSGDLYATTGPWFGTVPFNPASVTVTKVGTMTWTQGSFDDEGTLTYTVGGVSVTKNVIREPLVTEDYSGHFYGVIHQTGSGCANPTFNVLSETVGVLDIAQTGNAVTLSSVPASGPSCTYSGTITQKGQMGDFTGSYSCSNGFAGQFEIPEFQVTPVSVNGFFLASSSNPASCIFGGWIGGVSVTTF